MEQKVADAISNCTPEQMKTINQLLAAKGFMVVATQVTPLPETPTQAS